MPQRVLIFGFSVTNQHPGYVGAAMKLYDLDQRFHIEKFAVGGMSPPTARHIFSSVIGQLKPDVVILEMATSMYRIRRQTEALIHEHTQSMCSIFAQCATHGASCVVFDLPRDDLNLESDWMGPLHEYLCNKYGVARLELPLLEGTLADEVHTNTQGDSYYAKGLHDLLHALPDRRGMAIDIEDTPWFDAIPVDQLFSDSAQLRHFSRGACVFTAHIIIPGKPLVLEFEKPVLFAGVTSLFSPMTGNIRIKCDGKVLNRESYDKFSYYERLGQIMQPPQLTKKIEIEQLDSRPGVELLKGAAYDGHRVGSIVHILVQTESREIGPDFTLVSTPQVDQCDAGDVVLKDDNGGVRFLFDLCAQNEGNEIGSVVVDLSQRSGAADIVSMVGKQNPLVSDMYSDRAPLRSYIRGPMEAVYDLNRATDHPPYTKTDGTQEFLVAGYYTLPKKEHWYKGNSLLPLFSASQHRQGYQKSAELVILGMKGGPWPYLDARRQIKIGQADMPKVIYVPEDAFGEVVQIAYWRHTLGTGFTLRTKSDRHTTTSGRGVDNRERFTDMVPGWGACPPFLTRESKEAHYGVSVHRGWIENLSRSRRSPIETLEADWQHFIEMFNSSTKQ